MRLQVGIYTPDGRLIADHTGRAHGLTWTTDEQGERSLEYRVPMSMREATRLFDRDDLYHVQVNRGAEILWQGRLSDPGMDVTADGTGVIIGATGYREAWGDLRYTALWSDTRVGEWEKLETDNDSVAAPEKFDFDTNNRLLISPKPGINHAGTLGFPRVGIIAYRVPNRGVRTNYAVQFTIRTVLPSNLWQVSLRAYTSAPASGLWTLRGGVGFINGTQAAQTFRLSASADIAAVAFALTTTDSTPLPGDPGTYRVVISNLRVVTLDMPVPIAVLSLSDITYSGSDIARSLLAYIRSVNPLQASDITFDVAETARILTDAVYEDMTPAEIMDQLAAIGTGTEPWVWGVQGKTLFFQPRFTGGRTWYADASAIRFVRSRASLGNRAYTIYRDASGTPLRTDRLINTDSTSRFGLGRDAVITLQSSDASLAQQLRSVALADNADPRPRAAVEIRRVATPSGAVVAPWRVRGGDTILIPGLPLTGSSAVERTRRFRIIEATYSADDNRVTVTPELPLPQLEYLISQR